MYNIDYIDKIISDLDSCVNKRCISCSLFDSGDVHCAHHLMCLVLPVIIELKDIKVSNDYTEECLEKIARNIFF